MRLLPKLDGTTRNKFDRAAEITIPFDLYYGPTYGVGFGATGFVRNQSALGGALTNETAVDMAVTASSAIGCTVTNMG